MGEKYLLNVTCPLTAPPRVSPVEKQNLANYFYTKNILFTDLQCMGKNLETFIGLNPK